MAVVFATWYMAPLSRRKAGEKSQMGHERQLVSLTVYAAFFEIPTGGDGKFCPMKKGPSGDEECELRG